MEATGRAAEMTTRGVSGQHVSGKVGATKAARGVAKSHPRRVKLTLKSPGGKWNGKTDTGTGSVPYEGEVKKPA